MLVASNHDDIDEECTKKKKVYKNGKLMGHRVR